MAGNVVVPQLGESVVEATVGKWLKQAGEVVAVGQVLVELQTDKVDVEVSADVAGVLGPILAPAGTDVKVGDLLATITAGDVASPRLTPVAQRLVQEHGLDPAGIPGSGPGGRITRQDVQSQLLPPAPPPPVAPPTISPLVVSLVPAGRKEERHPMSRRRRTIARRLVEAQHNAAMLTTFNEIDMQAVIELRKRRQTSFSERHAIKLGFMSFFVKASIAALKAFPRLNAEIQDNDIILKHYYDIGIAVGAEEGLVVPILRQADELSFAAIEKEIKKLAQQATDGTLALESLLGGTFTITNGGVFGSMLSTPILNPPQVAILGLHKIQERPVAIGGQVVIRPVMYVALSYDHRIVDGREAVQFLVRIKELLEEPELLLLEG